MKKYLKIIDKFLCKCIGLNEQKTQPSILKVEGKKISIISVESFKRHAYSKTAGEFISNKIEELDEISKKKIRISYWQSNSKKSNDIFRKCRN